MPTFVFEQLWLLNAPMSFRTRSRLTILSGPHVQGLDAATSRTIRRRACDRPPPTGHRLKSADEDGEFDCPCELGMRVEEARARRWTPPRSEPRMPRKGPVGSAGRFGMRSAVSSQPRIWRDSAGRTHSPGGAGAEGQRSRPQPPRARADVVRPGGGVAQSRGDAQVGVGLAPSAL